MNMKKRQIKYVIYCRKSSEDRGSDYQIADDHGKETGAA